MIKKTAFFVSIGLSLLFIGGIAFAREENYTFSGVKKLVVEGAFFSVDIMGRPENTVDARIIIPDSMFDDGTEVLHKQSGSELRFWVEKKNWADFNWPLGQSSEMSFKVPHDCAVEVRNSSGGVQVEGIRSRELQVHTSSGG